MAGSECGFASFAANPAGNPPSHRLGQIRESRGGCEDCFGRTLVGKKGWSADFRRFLLLATQTDLVGICQHLFFPSVKKLSENLSAKPQFTPGKDVTYSILKSGKLSTI